MRLTIREIVKLLNGNVILGDPQTVVRQACCDSRLVQKGDLFFALEGRRVDGHRYVLVACKEGAGGVVVSQLDWLNDFPSLGTAVIKVKHPYHALQKLGKAVRSKFKGPVVGITGSNGKTTTKQMLQSILLQRQDGLATTGNFNTQIGLPIVLTRLNENHKWIVLEMGATEPGNIHSLCEIAKPKLGVITSLGPAHLGSFGSLEKVAESKWELMESLPADGTAVLPWRLTILEPFIRRFKRKIVFFGSDSSCPVRSSHVEVGTTTRFKLHIGSDNREVTLPIAGRFNVSNALASASAAWILGRSLDDIAHGLEAFTPPEMRMEVHQHESGAILINDAYNANPTSTLESIRSLVETYPHKKKVVVLASMLELGADSDKWHFHVGSELGRFELNHVFLLGKEMEQLENGALTVKQSRKDIFERIHEAGQIVPLLQPYLNNETVILFKGSRSMGLDRPFQELLDNRPLRVNN